MTDILDTVLGQAVVCAYAIPVVGAGVAAGLSALQAVLDATRPTHTSPSDYSPAQALADLGQKISHELDEQQAKNELYVIQGWQLGVRDALETSPGLVVDAAKDFLRKQDFNTTFSALKDTKPGSEDRVKSLGTYFMARTTYHTLCMTWLHNLDGAPHDQMNWADVYRDIHARYTDSLSDALAYARDTVAMLDDAQRHARERADAKAAAVGGPYVRNAAFTAELRSIRAQSHVQLASVSEVADYLQFLDLYDQTSAALKSNPPPPQTSAGPVQVGPGAAAQPTLGPQPPGVARFLYETDANGGWVNVVADSPVAPGGLATQNAGSNLATIYYRFGGAPINGEFATQLAAAGQLAQANADLATAYDAHFGAGAHAADSTASPPRQDRLTSLLVPLSPATPPVGDSVYAVLYSVGPQLGAKGIEDEDGYRQIYADAFAAVADWNAQYPAIDNVRLTLLSTGAFAGTSGGPALRAQAAGLVIDAAVAALKAHPLLATLRFLVNTNDAAARAAGGAERTAFDTAARDRKITTFRQGFDVPLR